MSGFNLNDILNKRSKESAAPVWNFRQIPLEQIVPSPNNKYRICDIEEMADSIETDGLLHNLAVRKLSDSGLYELISGERRFRALQMLVARGLEGYATAPCKVEVEQSDVVAEIKLLRANSTARNLTDSERVYQANRLKELLTGLKKSGVKVPGRVRDIVAAELDISAAQVGRMESINDKLIPEAKAEFEKGNINMTAAYETSRLSADKQAEIVKDLQQGAKVDIKAVKQKRDPPALPPLPKGSPVNAVSIRPNHVDQKEMIVPLKPPTEVTTIPSPPDSYRVHDLKTCPEAFNAIASGFKPWEYRLNDRDYNVGDILHLMRYDPVTGEYNGQAIDVEVIYIMRGGVFGIPEDYVIMSVSQRE